MINRIGPPVENEDFYDREAELKFAWSLIQDGNSLLLSAPRRVGKTSFAKKILSQAKDKGWNIFEINLEKIKTETGFVKEFIKNIQEQSWWENFKQKSGDKITQILESIETGVEYQDVKTSFKLKSTKEDVYEKLYQLLDHDEQTIIMVDELAIFLSHLLKSGENGKDDTEFFLNWLRSFRQITGTKIRWIFCSSISIDSFANKHALSHTINDVMSFKIDAYSRDSSEKFLKLLCKNYSIEMSDELIEYTLDKIGWLLPFFIQLIFGKIHYEKEVVHKDIDKQAIDEAYQNAIFEKDLNTWDERLREYGELEADARHILKRLSMAHLGENRSTLFEALRGKKGSIDKIEKSLSNCLYVLKNDGYIMENDGKYLFRSPFLRDFWYNRFCK